MVKSFDKKNSFLKNENNKKDKERRSRNGDVKLNLIKDEIVNYFDWKKNIIALLLAICFTTAVISALYWGISWWGAREQRKQVQKAVDTEKIIELNQEIASSQKKVEKIESFEARMKKVNFMVSSHIYWTNFFDFLQRNTLSQIHFNGFSGSTNGSYTLSANAKEYAAIDAQVKQLLDNKYVAEASVLSASSNPGENGDSVKFTLELSVDPGIFINYKKQ